MRLREALACLRAAERLRALTLKPAAHNMSNAPAVARGLDTACAMPREVSTSELHFSPRAEHVGKYRDIRQKLDEDWHGRYSEARQALQDRIVDEFVGTGTISSRPWLVFTAGPMGAGACR